MVSAFTQYSSLSSEYFLTESFINRWSGQIPRDLALREIVSVHQRPGRQVYRAESAEGPVAVKVFWGDQKEVAEWTLKLHPWIGDARPPELLHAQHEPEGRPGLDLTWFITRWIEGETLDFSNARHVRQMTQNLARLHSIKRSSGAPDRPAVVSPKTGSGHPYEILVSRAVKSIGQSLQGHDDFQPDGLVQQTLETMRRLCDQDKDPSLIHGSLKPEHVLIDQAAVARFIDFDKTDFAPWELEVADVLSRIYTTPDLYERLAHEMVPGSEYRPSTFEEVYFGNRESEALDRWHHSRRDVLLVAALITMGRNARVLHRFAGNDPGNSKAIARQIRRAWIRLVRVAGG